MLHPIPQSLSYHDFADKRALWQIPNFANVVSNAPFLFVGMAGLLSFRKIKAPGKMGWVYRVLFLGILLTGLGSAYYHYGPSDDTLVYDRIPLSIVFMALLSATLSEFVSHRLGIYLLIPLVFLGIFSVWWWHFGALHGRGDLRLYGFVQFYPMLFIPLILWLFYDPRSRSTLRRLGMVVIWYAIAKVFELLDRPIYEATGIISGHSLKHLAAAVST
jgi:ceramidase